MISTAASETGARLAEVAEHLGFAACVPADDNDWVRLDQAVASGLVDRLVTQLVESEGRRDVAGSYLGSRLAGPVVIRTAGALVLDRRCPDPDPAGVALHLHPDGWFDRVAFTGGSMAVLPYDPAADRAGTVVVPDPAALRAWWAQRLVAAVEPLLTAVRARLPYGTRGLWGALADRIAGVATLVDRQAGGTGAGGWAQAGPLLDALAEVAPVALNRPSAQSVCWSGGEALFSIKGTCCLYYRTEADADPATGDAYCSTCPLVEPGCRARNLAGRLEEQAPC